MYSRHTSDIMLLHIQLFYKILCGAWDDSVTIATALEMLLDLAM